MSANGFLTSDVLAVGIGCFVAGGLVGWYVMPSYRDADTIEKKIDTFLDKTKDSAKGITASLKDASIKSDFIMPLLYLARSVIIIYAFWFALHDVEGKTVADRLQYILHVAIVCAAIWGVISVVTDVVGVKTAQNNASTSMFLVGAKELKCKIEIINKIESLNTGNIATEKAVVIEAVKSNLNLL